MWRTPISRALLGLLALLGCGDPPERARPLPDAAAARDGGADAATGPGACGPVELRADTRLEPEFEVVPLALDLTFAGETPVDADAYVRVVPHAPAGTSWSYSAWLAERPFELFVTPGRYDVVYESMGYRTAPAGRRVVREGLELRAATALVVDVPVVTLEGEVRVDGAPTSGQLCWLPEGVRGSECGAISGGRYLQRLVPGRYDVLALDVPCGPSGGCSGPVATGLTVDGPPGASVDFDLRTRVIAGRVERPSPGGALVAQSAAAGGRAQIVDVSPEGAFGVRLLEGTYRLDWSTGGPGGWSAALGELVVDADRLDLRYAPVPPPRLEGRLRVDGAPLPVPPQPDGPLEPGEPLPASPPRLVFLARDADTRVVTPLDAEGRYAVHLPPGRYAVGWQRDVEDDPTPDPPAGALLDGDVAVDGDATRDFEVETVTLSGTIAPAGAWVQPDDPFPSPVVLVPLDALPVAAAARFAVPAVQTGAVYRARVPPGRYAVVWAGVPLLRSPPFPRGAGVLRADLDLRADAVLDVAPTGVSVAVSPFVNGQRGGALVGLRPRALDLPVPINGGPPARRPPCGRLPSSGGGPPSSIGGDVAVPPGAEGRPFTLFPGVYDLVVQPVCGPTTRSPAPCAGTLPTCGSVEAARVAPPPPPR